MGQQHSCNTYRVSEACPDGTATQREAETQADRHRQERDRNRDTQADRGRQSNTDRQKDRVRRSKVADIQTETERLRQRYIETERYG